MAETRQESPSPPSSARVYLPHPTDIEEALKNTLDFTKIDQILSEMKQQKDKNEETLLPFIEVYGSMVDVILTIKDSLLRSLDQRVSYISNEIKNLQRLLRTSVSVAALKNTELQKEKMRALRKRTVLELYETEKTYLKAIEMLIDKNQNCYENKFRDLARLKGSNQSVWDMVFSQLPEIYMVNKKFFQEIEKCVEKWDKDEKIADLFLQWTSHFFVYNNFAANYYANDKAIEAALKEKPYSEKFDGAAVLEFRNCYIAPIQRLPRYEMMLQDIIKNTPQHYEEYTKLVQAMDDIKNVSKELNAHINNKQNEAMEKFIENNICPALLTERKLLSFLSVKVLIDISGVKPRTFNNSFLFLFDDYLVASCLLKVDEAGRFILNFKKLSDDEAFVTIPYVWISRDVTNDFLVSCGVDPKLVRPICTCILSSPRGKWIVDAADGKSGLDIWIEKVMPTFGTADAEQLAKGARPPGKWYSYPGKGEYCGGFLNTKPHGMGMFKAIDGLNYKGMWDANFDLGYGKVMAGGDTPGIENTSSEGWISYLSNKASERCITLCKEDRSRDWSFWSGNPEKLSQQDWELLLTGTAVVQLNCKSKILSLDHAHQSIYRIRLGKVRETANKGQFFQILNVGDLIGITALLGQKNYSESTCEEDVEVYAIPFSSLSKLLGRSHRLTFGLAYTVARQLINCLACFFGDHLVIGTHSGKQESGKTRRQKSDGTKISQKVWFQRIGSFIFRGDS